MKCASLLRLLLITSVCMTNPAHAAERVVIVMLDGLRATEGFDDPAFRYIPHMAFKLAPQGALARMCDNNGSTITIPGHAAVATGRYQTLPDDGSVRSIFPMLWEEYRHQTGAPERATTIYATKGKMYALSYSTWSDYGPPDSARVVGPTWDDTETTRVFLAEMVSTRPVISFLNFGSIDMAAHAGYWDDYIRRIEVADSCVAVIWESIQANPAYAGRTDLIVTGDHGRHSDGYGSWTAHGDGCPGCRRIPLLALGPDFRDGFVSWTRCEQVDLCKTVAGVLGISVSHAGGRVLSELLEPPAGVDEDGLDGGSVRVLIDGPRVRFLPRDPETPLRLSIHDVQGRRLGESQSPPGQTWSWLSPSSGLFFYRTDRETGRFLVLR
jgi:hypothetical protein